MLKSLNTFEKLLSYCDETGKSVHDAMIEVETQSFDVSENEIRKKTKINLLAMKEAISNGLKSKELSNSILSGDNCQKALIHFQNHKAIFGPVYEKISAYSLAVIEENARLGKIVACPTAGSCGIVPSVLIAISEELNICEDKQVDALITAGTIGHIVSAKVAPAGAVAGCQAECGLASAMAAAACVFLLDGTPKQIVNAATLALKNVLGLTCDPVRGLVEVPCVKRNVFLSIHAITAAELALANIESKISPDDVVNAMQQTGQLMSPLLKETSQGGLSVCKSVEEHFKDFD